MDQDDRLSAGRAYLRMLFDIAVNAAHPRACLAAHLPPPPERGRIVILAAGKAAGAMTEIAEQHYLDRLGWPAETLTGLAVTRHGYGRPTRVVPVIEAGHPLPDQAGLDATEQALRLADAAGEQDLVLVLLSGGASANWTAPADGLALGEKQTVTRALLACGASIGEINTVRKHLSRIKGGRLALRAHPARVVTLAISDVPGDDPAVIGSGPTVPDPSTLDDTRAVIARYRLDLPAAVERFLADPQSESPKPGEAAFAHSSCAIVARPRAAFEAVEAELAANGDESVFLGDQIEGEAREIAERHAGLALALQREGRRAIILSGGELTVTVRGQGHGGPNQEYALALALALNGAPGIQALAADTDGTDGGAGSPDDPAGAMIDETTLARARNLGLDPAAFLAENDATGFFARLGDLLMTGPTCTNINDFRAILVDRR
ncbi:MAG: glycerate kinase [Xanthobacteraceae bacterium]